MKTLITQPISAEAFEPFGQLLQAPAHTGRAYINDRLANERADAVVSLSMTTVESTANTALIATEMERHEFSSQSFIPLDVSRYLVVVAPHGANGRPDEQHMQAFVVPGHIGITYGVNVWHHSLRVLDRPAQFAVLMWKNETATDEEFVPLSESTQIILQD